MAYREEAKKSLLISEAVIQVPWIKVQIGTYTFGVCSKWNKNTTNDQGFYYTNLNAMYPNYVQNLQIEKINGQVNKYTLSLVYPLKLQEDPNFIDKVLSSVSTTRKIVFSYGDMNMPSYIYKDEEAIITKTTKKYNLQQGNISYTIYATSSAILSMLQTKTFKGGNNIKPSEEIIKTIDSDQNLKDLFPAMNKSNYRKLIAGDDKAVFVETKRNISSLDWISYLVSCMIPDSTVIGNNASSGIYGLAIHDDTEYDRTYRSFDIGKGSYFTVSRLDKSVEHTDALEVDIGFGNGAMLVTDFSIDSDEGYALMYNYATKNKNEYVERYDDNGEPFYAWAPQVSSKNTYYETRAEDTVWYTKMTQYPIKASMTVNGLIRAANLMTYIRVNVIAPGGRKTTDSGLYMITKQIDTIGMNGYRTQFSLIRIGGDYN